MLKKDNNVYVEDKDDNDEWEMAMAVEIQFHLGR